MSSKLKRLKSVLLVFAVICSLMVGISSISFAEDTEGGSTQHGQKSGIKHDSNGHWYACKVSGCTEMYWDNSTTDTKISHTWKDSSIVTAATCSSTGTKKQKCWCGEERTVTTPKDPNNHTYGDWSNYTSAQHRRRCSGCGTYDYAYHDMGIYYDYDANYHRRDCSDCDYYETGKHNYNKWYNDGIQKLTGKHWKGCSTGNCKHEQPNTREAHSADWSNTLSNHLCPTCNINVFGAAGEPSFHYFPDGKKCPVSNCGHALTLTSIGEMSTLSPKEDYKMLPDTSTDKSISKATVTYSAPLYKTKTGTMFDKVTLHTVPYSHGNWEAHAKHYEEFWGAVPVAPLIAAQYNNSSKFPLSLEPTPYSGWTGIYANAFLRNGTNLVEGKISGNKVEFTLNLSGHHELDFILIDGTLNAAGVHRLWAKGGDSAIYSKVVVAYRSTKGDTIDGAPDDKTHDLTNKYESPIYSVSADVATLKALHWRYVGWGSGLGSTVSVGSSLNSGETASIAFVRGKTCYIVFVFEKMPTVNVIYRTTDGTREGDFASETPADTTYYYEDRPEVERNFSMSAGTDLEKSHYRFLGSELVGPYNAWQGIKTTGVNFKSPR